MKLPNMVLYPVVLLCLLVAISSTLVASEDVYNVHSAALLIHLSSEIPKHWLEHKSTGKAVFYTNLMDFGKKSAKYILEQTYKDYEAKDKEQRKEQGEDYDEEYYIKNYVKDTKYEVSLDKADILRITFFGATRSTEDVWDYHITAIIEEEQIVPHTSYLITEFDKMYKANPGVVPDEEGIDKDDFPKTLTATRVSTRFYMYPDTCGNGKKDGDEVDTDCGGVDCPPCAKKCKVDDDCHAGYKCSEEECKSTVAPNVDSASIISVTIAAVVSIAATLTLMI